MYRYNRGFVPSRSSVDTNQMTNPSQPVSPVPTRPNNQNQSGFMNLLNQPLSWDPNLYDWNPNHNMGGFGSSQAFSSAQAFGSQVCEPDFVPDTQTEPQPLEEKAQKNKTTRSHKKKVVVEARTKKTSNYGMIRGLRINSSLARRFRGPRNW
ncbi:hypothetical protein Hanom_Chr16g01438121 [Helianthus anomalus]